MPKYNIGCSNFSDLEWRGYFFPKNMPVNNHLKYYAENFSAVEINSTFYKTPSLETLRSWYEQTPAYFDFFVKIPKSITHTDKMRDTAPMINKFIEQIEAGLKDKLKGFLFLLPPSFYNTDENQKRLFANIKTDYQKIIEFRNASWWSDDKLAAKFKKRDLIMSGISLPMENIPDMIVINHPDIIYYKLYGTPKMHSSEYSKEFLDNLADEIKVLKKDANVIFANINGTAAIDNAIYLQKILK